MLSADAPNRQIRRFSRHARLSYLWPDDGTDQPVFMIAAAPEIVGIRWLPGLINTGKGTDIRRVWNELGILCS